MNPKESSRGENEDSPLKASSHLEYVDATASALCNVAEQLRLVDLSEPFVKRLDRVARVDADIQRGVVLIEDVIDGLPLLVFALLGEIGELCYERALEYLCDRNFSFKLVSGEYDESYYSLSKSIRYPSSDVSLILSEEQSPAPDGGQNDEVERRHFATSTFDLPSPKTAEVTHFKGAPRIAGSRSSGGRSPKRSFIFKMQESMMQLAIYDVHPPLVAVPSRLVRSRLYSLGQCAPPSTPDSLYQISSSCFDVAYPLSRNPFPIRLSQRIRF